MPDSVEEVLARLQQLAETGEDHVREVVPFLSDPAPEVREAAVWALWAGDLSLMTEPLLERLDQDEDALVQSAVVTILGRYVYEGAMMPPEEKSTPLGRQVLKVTRLLRQLLEAPETPPLIRRRALESLSFDADEALEETILTWAAHPEPLLRKSAAFALGRVTGQRFTAALLELLSDTDSRVVIEAIRSVGEHGVKKAVPALIALSRVEEEDVAREAVAALGLVGGAKAVAALKSLALDPRPWMSETAAAALEEANS